MFVIDYRDDKGGGDDDNYDDLSDVFEDGYDDVDDDEGDDGGGDDDNNEDLSYVFGDGNDGDDGDDGADGDEGDDGDDSHDGGDGDDRNDGDAGDDGSDGGDGAGGGAALLGAATRRLARLSLDAASRAAVSHQLSLFSPRRSALLAGAPPTLPLLALEARLALHSRADASPSPRAPAVC